MIPPKIHPPPTGVAIAEKLLYVLNFRRLLATFSLPLIAFALSVRPRRGSGVKIPSQFVTQLLAAALKDFSGGIFSCFRTRERAQEVRGIFCFCFRNLNHEYFPHFFLVKPLVFLLSFLVRCFYEIR